MTAVALDTKIVAVENKIPDTSGLVTTAVLNTNFDCLIKEIDCNAKVSNIEIKFYYFYYK